MNRFFGDILSNDSGILSEEESKHCALILRHQKGDTIEVMNGKGMIYTCVLTSISKKGCEFQVVERREATPKKFRTHLLISPTKNIDRMEWLIEKLCEIGVDEVTFILTQNSERRKLRMDRLEKKAISAMKQSGNPFLTQLNDLTAFEAAIENVKNSQKLIAHVDREHTYIGTALKSDSEVTILIGPEGDFTKDEVKTAISQGFEPVSLGSNTLRTETAGFAACCHVNFVNRS